MGKRKNKRANAKIKRAGTGESTGGSSFVPVCASRSLSSFAFSPLSRSLEQAKLS